MIPTIENVGMVAGVGFASTPFVAPPRAAPPSNLRADCRRCLPRAGAAVGPTPWLRQVEECACLQTR
jgi:hypothetical protein